MYIYHIICIYHDAHICIRYIKYLNIHMTSIHIMTACIYIEHNYLCNDSHGSSDNNSIAYQDLLQTLRSSKRRKAGRRLLAELAESHDNLLSRGWIWMLIPAEGSKVTIAERVQPVFSQTI